MNESTEVSQEFCFKKAYENYIKDNHATGKLIAANECESDAISICLKESFKYLKANLPSNVDFTEQAKKLSRKSDLKSEEIHGYFKKIGEEKITQITKKIEVSDEAKNDYIRILKNYIIFTCHLAASISKNNCKPCITDL